MGHQRGRSPESHRLEYGIRVGFVIGTPLTRWYVRWGEELLEVDVGHFGKGEAVGMVNQWLRVGTLVTYPADGLHRGVVDARRGNNNVSAAGTVRMGVED